MCKVTLSYLFVFLNLIITCSCNRQKKYQMVPGDWREILPRNTYKCCHPCQQALARLETKLKNWPELKKKHEDLVCYCNIAKEGNEGNEQLKQLLKDSNVEISIDVISKMRDCVKEWEKGNKKYEKQLEYINRGKLHLQGSEVMIYNMDDETVQKFYQVVENEMRRLNQTNITVISLRDAHKGTIGEYLDALVANQMRLNLQIFNCFEKHLLHLATNEKKLKFNKFRDNTIKKMLGGNNISSESNNKNPDNDDDDDDDCIIQ